MMSPKLRSLTRRLKRGVEDENEKGEEVFHEWEQPNMNKLLFNKVVDVPVVQVPQFIDGVDVPVSMQRRRLALGGATDSVLRLMVDLPVAPRQGAFSKVYMR